MNSGTNLFWTSNFPLQWFLPFPHAFSVADNFGVATYAIVLFLLTVWWSQVWGDASACPYTHMEEMVEGNVTPRDVALKTWAQLMGGCCVWRFVQFFWWLELAQTHRGRAFEDCSADLQVNPLPHSWNFFLVPKMLFSIRRYRRWPVHSSKESPRFYADSRQRQSAKKDRDTLRSWTASSEPALSLPVMRNLDSI